MYLVGNWISRMRKTVVILKPYKNGIVFSRYYLESLNVLIHLNTYTYLYFSEVVRGTKIHTLICSQENITYVMTLLILRKLYSYILFFLANINNLWPGSNSRPPAQRVLVKSVDLIVCLIRLFINKIFQRHLIRTMFVSGVGKLSSARCNCKFYFMKFNCYVFLLLLCFKT